MATILDFLNFLKNPWYLAPTVIIIIIMELIYGYKKKCNYGYIFGIILFYYFIVITLSYGFSISFSNKNMYLVGTFLGIAVSLILWFNYGIKLACESK